MKIGLTGSIACGKSTVSQYLRQKGCFIVDADAISRALTADGGAALTEIRRAFGDDVFSGASLDRAKLGQLVFAEVKLRRTAHFGAAREFVDLRKQERLRATASMFLEEHETALQPRFDVIEIYAPDGLQTRHPYLRQIEDAFYEI